MKELNLTSIVRRLDSAAAAQESDTPKPTRKASRKGKPEAALGNLDNQAKTKLHVHIDTLLSTLQVDKVNKLQNLKDGLPHAVVAHGDRLATIREKQEVLGRIELLLYDAARGTNLYSKVYKPDNGLTDGATQLRALVSERMKHQRLRKTMSSDAYAGAAQGYGPSGGLPKSTAALSRINLAALSQALGPMHPNEQKLYERVMAGPMFFKHATDSFEPIQHEGLLLSPDLGPGRNGTSEKNVPFDHTSYVFGRLELKAGPMASRFGGTTLEIPFDALPENISITMHDQCMPLATLPQKIEHAGEIVRQLSEVGKYAWQARYPAAEGDPKAVDLPHKGSILDDVFVGRAACREAVALHLLVELRRMAGVGQQSPEPANQSAGAAFRKTMLDADDETFVHLFRQLVRPQILVPRALALPKTTTVYNAAGCGLFSQGRPDPEMKKLNDAWNGQKKNLDGQTPTISRAFEKALKSLQPHLDRLTQASKNKKLSPEDLAAHVTTFEVLCTWHSRLLELKDRTSAATDAPNASNEQVDGMIEGADKALRAFARRLKGASYVVMEQGKNYAIQRPLA